MQQSLSLYIQLEDGKLANIETVAKAALEFSQAVKEIAFILDPSMDVEVCLLNGTEGSLDLNAFIRNIKVAIVPSDRAQQIARLRAIAVGMSAFLIGGAADYIRDKLFDRIAGDAKSELTDNDIAQIAEKTAEIVEKKAGKYRVQAMVSALAADPSVIGVGVSETHGVRPDYVLPRSQFPELSYLSREIWEDGNKRVVDAEERVGLVSPVLIPGTKRRWKFQTRFGEIGATMADTEFQEELSEGRLPIPLRAGIEMDVTIQIAQEKLGPLWVPKEYRIIKVYRIHPGDDQPDLILH